MAAYHSERFSLCYILDGIVAWLVSSSLVDMPVSRLALLQKAVSWPISSLSVIELSQPLLDVLHESITEGLGAGLFLEGEDIQVLTQFNSS